MSILYRNFKYRHYYNASMLQKIIENVGRIDMYCKIRKDEYYLILYTFFVYPYRGKSLISGMYSQIVRYLKEKESEWFTPELRKVVNKLKIDDTNIINSLINDNAYTWIRQV